MHGPETGDMPRFYRSYRAVPKIECLCAALPRSVRFSAGSAAYCLARGGGSGNGVGSRAGVNNVLGSQTSRTGQMHILDLLVLDSG